ncbi:MAG: DUF1289 domain-containing protein [Pseudomonadota bacterium]
MDREPARPRRQNRRGSRRKEIDHSVPSPCVKVCMFKGTPFCDGCFRTLDEIREWMIMSREEKLAVLDRIEQRKNGDGPSH